MAITHIQAIELSNNQSSVTFNSIPQSYDDLIVTINAKTSRGNTSDLLSIRLNGNSSNQESGVIEGTNSGVTHYSLTTLQVATSPGASYATASFSDTQVYISDYTTNKGKSLSAEGVFGVDGVMGSAAFAGGHWDNAAAVTSIVVQNVNASNLLSGSTFSLYGVTAA